MHAHAKNKHAPQCASETATVDRPTGRQPIRRAKQHVRPSVCARLRPIYDMSGRRGRASATSERSRAARRRSDSSTRRELYVPESVARRRFSLEHARYSTQRPRLIRDTLYQRQFVRFNQRAFVCVCISSLASDYDSAWRHTRGYTCIRIECVRACVCVCEFCAIRRHLIKSRTSEWRRRKTNLMVVRGREPPVWPIHAPGSIVISGPFGYINCVLDYAYTS